VKRAALLCTAFASDLLLGDPHWFPHPVRGFGALAALGERSARCFTRDDAKREAVAGTLLALAIVSFAYAAASVTGKSVAERDARLGSAYELVLAWTTLATRDLLAEARAVAAALEAGDLELARRRLGRIVGRDTVLLDESEIARAVIETLAESVCDGVVAPLCALAAGGVPLALAFKAASTLDSLIGHNEPPYTYFGRFAARLDDVACWLPARLTALGIALFAVLGGGSTRAAFATWRADGGRHPSPNAGRPEAALAGALGVRLGGTNIYDGIVRRSAYLGASFRAPQSADIQRAERLISLVAYGAAASLCLASFVFDAR